MVDALGSKADPDCETIAVDGQPILTGGTRFYLILNKPVGYLSAKADPRGRPLVTDLVGPLGRQVHPVGRLDWDSEGLLLLTNDGDLTYQLTHPRFGVQRVYEIQVEGEVSAGVLSQIRRGVELEDGTARPEAVDLLRRQGATWLRLLLREGRYREVRRLCRAVGLRVLRLRRVGYGPLRLGRLETGKWRFLTARELRGLQRTPREPPRAPFR